VRLYKRGELVKIHPRKPRGGRSTDPDDYPKELRGKLQLSQERPAALGVAYAKSLGIDFDSLIA
jgi:hypothetical protein